MAAHRQRLLQVLQLAALVLLAVQPAAHAQETNNGQGKILWAMGQWLSGSQAAAPIAAMGWSNGGNPCVGSWQGVTCNPEGYVTSVNLSGRGLTGLIPSDPGLWSGLTGLNNLDLSNNQLTGSVPAAIKSAPLLSNVNLGDNRNLCGYLPNALAANTQNTNIGTQCTTTAAAPSPVPVATPSPAPLPSPAASPITITPEPSPTPPIKAGATPSPTPAAAAEPFSTDEKPAPPPTVISSAPICSCALRGFGSPDCSGALAAVCRAANPPAVCNSSATVMNDTAAATAMGQYLADTCFKGQNMDTSVCSCVQNLLGNDCAKARVSLCEKEDPLCLPIQNVVSESGSDAAPDAAQQVATALDAQCSVAEPAQAGVKATMEFPDLSMGQYITKQYTQNVANALSSVTNVPTSSISTLDVRPFTGAARSAAAPKRRLMQQQQAAGNGVQATYFLATEDPPAVSQRLSTAANDGTLSARLAQYGITAQAGGLRVQKYLQPPAPPAPSGSSFPLWALAPIIVGSLLLLGALAALLWCCCCRKKRSGKKATEYAPSSSKPVVVKGPSGRNYDDLAAARDMPPKGGYEGPGTAGYAAAGAAAAAGGYKAAGYKASSAASPSYKATASSPSYKSSSPAATPTAYDPAGNGKMLRGGSSGAAVGSGVAVGAAAAAAAAAGTAAAVKRSGSSRVPRPESPASSKGSGSHISPAGIAGAGASAGGPAHLSTLQSMKPRGVDYDEPIARSGSGGSSTLTPWEAASRPAGGSSSSMQPQGAAAAAGSGVTGSSMRAAGVAAGAGLAAGAGGAAALGASRGSGSLAPAGSSELSAQASGSTTGWKSNVRPASGQLPNAGGSGGSSMMANPPGKSVQQAERAKFWAQFQETWQQVRQTQNVDHEPGSPSSGTNWTDITDARPFRQQS